MVFLHRNKEYTATGVMVQLRITAISNPQITFIRSQSSSSTQTRVGLSSTNRTHLLLMISILGGFVDHMLNGSNEGTTNLRGEAFFYFMNLTYSHAM